MAAPPGPPPWNDAEKNSLLAEMIKQAGPSPTTLFNMLLSLNAPQPRWGDLPLPWGRTLNESMQAYDTIRQRAGAQALIPPNLLPGLGPQTPSPLSAPVTLKRHFPFENINVGREIRPKPSSTGSVYGQPSPVEQPARKKRGRPTKAEAAARAGVQGGAAESSSATRLMPAGNLQPYPPPAPASEPGLATETSPTEATRPPVSRVPISSMITPTAPTTASQSSSSSGKRRRGRSTRSEPESFPIAGTLGTRQTAGQQYESPYAIAGPDPAPAAVMRYPEEPQPSSPRQTETRTPTSTYQPGTSMPEHTRST